MLHPNLSQSFVRYYYLAARNGSSAEVIKVLNSQRHTIDVPLWEEDVILEPIFTRPMTRKEKSHCKGGEVWKLFNDWDKFCKDLSKSGVEGNALKELEFYKNGLQPTDDTALV